MINKFTLGTIILLLATISLHAQERKLIALDPNNAMFISELKGVAIVENGKILIGPIPSPNQRDNEYKNLDLRQGDEILFINGNKINSLEDLKKIYKKLKIGEEVKLAVQRDGERFIAKFTKCDEKLNEPRLIRITADGKGEKGNVKVENGKVLMGGKNLDLDSLKKSENKLNKKNN